jgi:hypothetical protein
MGAPGAAPNRALTGVNAASAFVPKKRAFPGALFTIERRCHPRDVGGKFMAQQSARLQAECTNAVQLDRALITSVFRNQSVVKDHFNGSNLRVGIHATQLSTARKLS